MRKKTRAAAAGKREKSGAKGPFPDNDPEWEHLEERFSQIDGSDMRKLAELLILQ